MTCSKASGACSLYPKELLGRDQYPFSWEEVNKPSLRKYHEWSGFNCLIELQLNP